MEDVPDDDAYSRVSDPQRYATLHRRARLLLARLASVFEVTVDDRVTELPDGFGSFIEAHRLLPALPAAAPVTIALTDFPGLIVYAGHGWSRPYPQCGCDACDEDADEVFTELERHLHAVAHGRFAETRRGEWYEAEFRYPGGAESGGGLLGPGQHSVPEGRTQWAPWPRNGDLDAVASAWAIQLDDIDLSPAVVVREHLEAFNAHDTARLLGWFADDAVWITGTDGSSAGRSTAKAAPTSPRS
jgi:hypothetical protein